MLAAVILLLAWQVSPCLVLHAFLAWSFLESLQILQFMEDWKPLAR